MKLRRIIKQKPAFRFMMLAGVVSIIVLTTIVTLIAINFGDNEETKAAISALAEADENGSDLNTGEILSRFEWENNPVTLATVGPNAVSAGKTATCSPGGRASTNGLNAGTSGDDINLIIKGTPYFDIDGIDVSIDFKRKELSGCFFARGESLKFGFNKGYVTIHYRVKNEESGFETVAATTDYFIPYDDIFRTFRFIYSPRTGKGEVFVGKVVIWNYEGNKNSKLYWKKAGDIVIGKDIDGGETNLAVLDNLVIRTTGTSMPLTESLLNFIAEPRAGEVLLRWSVQSAFNIDKFIIQRSVNGIDYSDVGSLNVKDAQPEQEYLFSDKHPNDGISFYRLKQTFADGKFVTHPVTAVKSNSNPKELVFDHISPDPFKEKIDVSYYAPDNGKVWMQIVDLQGKVVCSEFFGASKGKNVHVFTDHQNLPSGAYTLCLVFNDKKVKTKIIKA